jgi:hypothetical protein
MNWCRLKPRGSEAAADWESLNSTENYVGYEQPENFASPGGTVLDEPMFMPRPSIWRSITGAFQGLDDEEPGSFAEPG